MSKPPESVSSPTPPVAESDELQAAVPSKPKRAKRRRAQRERSSDADPKLNAQGRERPRFLLGFPDDPELAKLSRAFEAGNYAYVREHAPEVAARAADDDVRRAALELAERIKPDPLIKYLLMLSVALLVFLVIYAYGSHGH